MEAAAVKEGGCGAKAVSARHACSSRDYDPVLTSRSCYRTRAVAQAGSSQRALSARTLYVLLLSALCQFHGPESR